MLSNIRPVIVCAVLLTFGTVATQALGGEPANKQPVVIAAAASADQASIYIEGMNFGLDPQVFLAGAPLGGVLVNAAGTQIIANLPSFQPGSYALTVSAGKLIGGMDITIGAVGLTGDKGEQGEPGERGPQGDQGVQGETGAVGATGATGATGDTGPKGDQGDPGTDGTNGTNGTNGTDGAQGLQGPAGQTGPQGPPGPAAPGTLQSMRVQGPTVGLGGDGFAHASATCPAGWTLTGGGFRAAGVTILESFQGPRNLNDPAVDTWFVAGATGFLGAGAFDAWATCARIAP